MANHTDDCPDCGADRRLSPICCPAEAHRVKAMRCAFEEEQTRRRALFDRLGIEHRSTPHYSGAWEVVPHLPSLLAVLQQIDDRMAASEASAAAGGRES